MPMQPVTLPKNKKVMNSMEKKLSRNDKIFATLTHNGRRLANINGKNFGSVSEIMKLICTKTGKWIGIAILTIRNYNQGWSINVPVTFKPLGTSQLQHDGRQYTLPLFS